MALAIAGLLAVLGGLIVAASEIALGDGQLSRVGQGVGGMLLVSGVGLAIVVAMSQGAKEEVARQKRIEAVEKRVHENPRET